MKALLALILFLFTTAAFATGGGSTPPPTPTTFSQPPAGVDEGERKREAFWAGAAVGGLGVTALQKSEHPWLYTVGAGVAAAALMQAADKLNDDQFKHAAAGVAVGATGVGLVFGKKFFGWQTAIKW